MLNDIEEDNSMVFEPKVDIINKWNSGYSTLKMSNFLHNSVLLLTFSKNLSVCYT